MCGILPGLHQRATSEVERHTSYAMFIVPHDCFTMLAEGAAHHWLIMLAGKEATLIGQQQSNQH